MFTAMTPSSMTTRIAEARRQLLSDQWEEAALREDLARRRASVRQAIIDDLPGYDDAGKVLGIRALGPNQETQTAAIEALILQNTDIVDAEDLLRVASRKREIQALELQILLDEQSADHWLIRREAVARGVSLGDGALS